MMSSILVTGGSGQLGTLVLRRLVADPAVRRVVCVDKRPPLVSGPKLQYVPLDVRSPELERHLGGIEAVVHLAFVVTELLERRLFDDINIRGSRSVFEAAQRAGVKTIVYASSLAAYGVVPGHPQPLTEGAPRVRQPEFAYPHAKYEVEALLDAFEDAHPDVRVVRLRPGILIGAGMEHALAGALDRRRVPVFSETPQPYVLDEDVADAVLLACRKPVRGAFNLCAEPVPFSQMLKEAGYRPRRVPRSFALAAVSLTNAGARLGVGRTMDPGWIRYGDVPMIASSRRALEELGWRPRARTATDVLRAYDGVTLGASSRGFRGFVRLLSVSARLLGRVDDLRRYDTTVNVQVAGRGGGAFHLRSRGGRLRVGRGLHRPPSATVTVPAKLFVELLAGRASLSTAQLTGRWRLEGEGHAGMVAAAAVNHFALSARAAGVRGALPRRLLHAMEEGVAR